MTPRPCAIFICCAYATPGSEFCSAHAHLQAQGQLDVDTGRAVTRRRSTSGRRRDGDGPNADARLPLFGSRSHRTE